MKRFETLPFFQPDKSVIDFVGQYHGLHKNNVIAGATVATFLMSKTIQDREVIHEEIKQILSKDDFIAYEDILETLARIIM